MKNLQSCSTHLEHDKIGQKWRRENCSNLPQSLVLSNLFQTHKRLPRLSRFKRLAEAAAAACSGHQCRNKKLPKITKKSEYFHRLLCVVSVCCQSGEAQTD